MLLSVENSECKKFIKMLKLQHVNSILNIVTNLVFFGLSLKYLLFNES